MYPAGNLFIPVEHGRLEAILKDPHGVPTCGAALVLHPHPLHGGTMHNKVVFHAARALNEAGFITLRINFRGVGQSTGTHDEARGEQTDARAGLDYLTSTYADLPLTLAGFSFGARVGLEVGIREDRVVNLIGIGTPINMYDFSFLQSCPKPLLLVHGAQDEFGDSERLRRLAASLPAAAHLQLEIVPDADHFFKGHLDEMSRLIKQWASGRMKAEG